MIQTRPTVTRLIDAWRDGDGAAGAEVLDRLYADLRALAGRALGRERPGHTLQPTALVHEAWLRLDGEALPPVVDRDHLLAITARLMRQVLVNHAVRRNTVKRGRGWRRIALDPALALHEARGVDLVALDEALTRLGEFDERLVRVVELRFFAGLTMTETAQALGASLRGVERDWAVARAWLRREMDGA